MLLALRSLFESLPGGSAKLFAMTIDQLEAVSTAITRTRSTSFSVAEVEAYTAATSRVRSIQTTLNQTDNFTTAFARQRAVQAVVNEIQSVASTVNRLRTVTVQLDQATTYGMSFVRFRQLLQTIAQTEGLTFELSVIHQTPVPDTVVVKVDWDEWNVTPSEGGAIACQVHKQEFFSFDSKVFADGLVQTSIDLPVTVITSKAVHVTVDQSEAVLVMLPATVV